MTERGDHAFTVREYSGGQPWIMLQPMRAQDEVAVLKRGFLGFDLQDGASYGEGQRLADLLREKVKAVTYTPL
jgi:hypothetical protein